MPFISEIEDLKILYSEIINGFSWDETHQVYIKHLDELENIEVTRYKQLIFGEYVKKGVSSIEDRLKSLIANEEWSEAKEEQILTLKYNISDNERNIQNIIPEQQPPIRRIIDKFKVDLRELQAEKQQLLGMTADSFAERTSFNYMIYLSVYNSDKVRLFKSFDQFDESAQDGDIAIYGQLLEGVLGKITNKVINSIAVMPFFLNNLSYSKDNISTFLNKPMINLSHYQAALLNLGLRNLSVLNNTDAEPPQLLDDVKIDDLIFFYDKNYSVLLGKSKSAKSK